MKNHTWGWSYSCSIMFNLSLFFQILDLTHYDSSILLCDNFSSCTYSDTHILILSLRHFTEIVILQMFRNLLKGERENLVVEMLYYDQYWGAGTFFHRLPAQATSKKEMDPGTMEPFL